jgi:hypothetical protein
MAALDGVLVVDLSRAVAGPHAGMMLGDFGARVIKIESPGGDDSRHWGPPFVKGESTYFLSVNRNKESVVLDLKDESGRRALDELIRRADVLIENFKVGTLARLGFSEERVRELNPRIVILSITGFGHDGPAVDVESPQFAGLAKTLVCSTVGTRVIGVIPNSEAFADQAEAAGLGADDVLLFVIDVAGVVPAPLDEATGTPVDPLPGFPEVVFADGKPTVTIPEGAVPTEYAIETLIQGDGDVVPDGATVVVNYHGVNWNSGLVFDSSFDRGAPATFSTAGVIQGFRDAIVGQKIGSRVVVIIPSDLGYGDAGSGDMIKGGDTLVFVIDILGLG